VIDFYLVVGILLVALVLGFCVHATYPYAGRAALLAWVVLEAALGGWYAWRGGEIFLYTWLATAIPAGLLLLLIGLPFEVVRRRRIRLFGEIIRRTGGFACPHCGLAYDREQEDGRCPDCGGAADGAPGVLG
jgi:DNA-directed RNA polymerase subunit RPC12/RpoP